MNFDVVTTLAVSLSRKYPQYTVAVIIWELPGALVARMLIQLRTEAGHERPGTGANSPVQVALRKRLAGMVGDGN